MVPGVTIRAPVGPRYAAILTAEALAFLAALHRRFDAWRRELLTERVVQQEHADAGEASDISTEFADRRVAIVGAAERETPDAGVHAELNAAVPIVRPRGWQVTEPHIAVDERPIAAALFDFGLYAFHNARAALAQGSPLFVDLPSLESDREARLWNDVFAFTEETLALPAGCIKVAVPGPGP